MLLGGHVFPKTQDPYEMASLLQDRGYRAGYCPEDLDLTQTERVRDLKKAFAEKNIVIAEAGAWCNPMSKDPKEAKQAKEYICMRLALAEEIGARCCVDVIGTYDTTSWGGPCFENFTEDFYVHAIDTAREIVDAVKPKRTKMSYEIVPWNFLDGADGYLRFIKDVDRKEIGIHLDPINCIHSAQTYYRNRAVFQDVFEKLKGHTILSVHLKDIQMRHDKPNVQLEEVRLGLGEMDLAALLTMLNNLPSDTPVMLEHLPDDEEYQAAARFARTIAAGVGINLS